jgi:CxxC motif-containing protein (DUF1111 family)
LRLPTASPLVLLASLAACGEAPRFDAAEPGEHLAGGATTVQRLDRSAYLAPAANLGAEQRLDFSAGNSFARNPWVVAPSSTTARDGLGPLFNSTACQNCHVRNGRGQPPAPDASHAVSMLVRLSLPDHLGDPALLRRQGVLGEPVYGVQLQDMAIAGHVPEAKVRVDYTPRWVSFTDGSRVELREPRLRISQLGYGPMHPDTRFSARVATPMIGLGLLEAIPAEAILANAARQAQRNDGIHGRANLVWDASQGTRVLGRFGWKAGQPSLDQQNAHAFAHDMGLTSRLLPSDDCSGGQPACLAAPNGNGAENEGEVSDNIRRLVLFQTRHIGVPARRDVDDPAVLRGKQLFHQAGCQTCHVPSYTTGTHAEPALAGQRIWPYSDLLLHDMGEGLADGRSEFAASGRDWRTPPLWGIGLSATVSGHSQFLHDGRARNLLEAVLWHGGEAEAAQRQVLGFNSGQREALLAFLNSL